MARYTPLISIPGQYYLRILLFAVFVIVVISIYSLSYLRPETTASLGISTDSLSFWRGPKEKYPFCQRCAGPDNDPICEEYGEDLLRRSVAYEGTSRRLKTKIKKAQDGQPIKMAVLGGSVSAGHGLDDRSNTYHQVFFNWWQSQFPHNENQIFQGAVPATDSAYYAYCFDKHIPLDVDIVFLEFALNDGSSFPTERNGGDPNTGKMMETLVRNILRLPNEPAIIFVSFFSYNTQEYFDGQESHLPVANYYDITFISLKNSLYDHLNRHPDEFKPYFYWDGHHPNPQGHRIAADFVIHHVQQQICTLERARGRISDGKNKFSMNESLSMVDMWTHRWDHDKFRELEPACHTFTDPNFRPKETHGWDLWNWQGEKYYIVAQDPGANLTFSIKTNQGVVYLYVLKSKSYGLGDVWCWADANKEEGRQISGYWDKWYSVGVMVPVVEGLSPGEHDIHCEILPKERSGHPEQGTHFRILAIVSG